MAKKTSLKVEISPGFLEVRVPSEFIEYTLYPPTAPHYPRKVKGLLTQHHHEEMILMTGKNWMPPDTTYPGVFFKGSEDFCFFYLLSGRLHQLDYQDIRKLWVPRNFSDYKIYIPKPDFRQAHQIV